MVLALVRAVSGRGRACGKQAEGEADARVSEGDGWGEGGRRREKSAKVRCSRINPTLQTSYAFVGGKNRNLILLIPSSVLLRNASTADATMSCRAKLDALKLCACQTREKRPKYVKRTRRSASRLGPHGRGVPISVTTEWTESLVPSNSPWSSFHVFCCGRLYGLLPGLESTD